MTDQLKERLSKVYALINQGATEGERSAAKNALDRILAAHNINPDQLFTIVTKTYTFTYSSLIELYLIQRIAFILKDVTTDKMCRGRNVFYIEALTYECYIVIDCAYEYYRRHMKKEWKRLCIPELNKCRKAKTKAKRRAVLQEIFFSNYIIASNLYKEGELKKSIPKSNQEYKDRSILKDVEGGSFNTQLNRGLFLEK